MSKSPIIFALAYQFFAYLLRPEDGFGRSNTTWRTPVCDMMAYTDGPIRRATIKTSAFLPMERYSPRASTLSSQVKATDHPFQFRVRPVTPLSTTVARLSETSFVSIGTTSNPANGET